MMVFLFIVISKVGNMESAVNVLKESSKLGQ
jgi:hypothetical protein